MSETNDPSDTTSGEVNWKSLGHSAQGAAEAMKAFAAFYSNTPPPQDEQPNNWENLFLEIHAYGASFKRWKQDEAFISGRFIRAVLKEMTFVQRYSQHSTHSHDVQWLLNLSYDELHTRMAKVKSTRIQALVDLADKLNEGVTRDQLPEIEQRIPLFSGQAKSRRDFSLIDAATRASGIPVPTVYDKALSEANEGRSVTGRSISPLREPDHISSILREDRRSFPLDQALKAIAEYGITGMCQNCQDAFEAQDPGDQEPCFCRGDDYDVLHLAGTEGCIETPGNNA